MGKIIFVVNTDIRHTLLTKAKIMAEDEGGFSGEGKVFIAEKEAVWNEEWEQKLTGATVVIMNWMGLGIESPFFRGARRFFQQHNMTYKITAGDEAEEKDSVGFIDEDHQLIQRYETYGGIENHKNLWCWLFCRFDQAACKFALPKPLHWHGIYHPRAQTVYTDLEQYEKDFCQPGRPTLGFLFYRNEWLMDNLAYHNAVIEEAERQGFNIVAVFSQGIANAELAVPGLKEAIRKYFMKDGKTYIDVMINTMKFSLTASGALAYSVIAELNVPQLQAYTLLTPVEQWRESMEGMSAMEVSISITLPEFDGIIHGIPIAGKHKDDDGMVSYEPIADRINLLVRRAGKWAALRYKANAEKKIAIIFHNYPPKNSNIGTAFGMDSPESVRLLLAAMKEQGYAIDHIPADSKSFMEEVIRCATNDRRFMTDEQIRQAIGRVSKAEYQLLFDTFSPKVTTQMTDGWGEPPGEVFNFDDQLLVPGMKNGNILITVQPPRGFGEEPGKIYHSPDSPPTHHYLAYYYWLRDIWQADAVVHVGTHGSLEWLPGKGTGLSTDCYPDIAIGDLPDIYPYIVTIVGEGVQAKRRGAACLIDYLTPPMSSAGTYDELEELEKLVDEYCHFQISQPDKAESAVPFIREKIVEAHLAEDLAQGAEEDFGAYVGRIHAYVTDIKNMQIRVGLHILGNPPQGEVLREYLLALTKIENGQVPSLAQTLAKKDGYDYYELLENSAQLVPGENSTYGRLADGIRAASAEIIEALMDRDFAEEAVAEIVNLQDYGQMPPALQEDLRTVCRYICTDIAPNLGRTVQEMTNTLRALGGEFIEPAPGGAPTSGRADVLPTGRNFYGVDPRLLPTKLAWETGKKMADAVINDYIAAEGRYPESIGIILWAGANMRTHGECIGQFLYLMGIRPIWQKGSGRVVGLEVMPMDELRRPRIDVTGRVSGLLRDSMPCAVAWMDKAAQLAAELEESPEMNYVRKHVAEDSLYLEEQGLSTQEAKKQAMYRLFGCPPGGYGAGVANVLEEKNWETVDDLAQVYVRWGAHVYGQKEKGQYLPELFKRRLSTIDATIHNEDNREISILNSDDFNSYHGGMIASVRSLRGKAPRSYCGDSTDKSHVVMRSLQDEIKRLFRGEAMNPKFIEGMKKHGYKGAADLANYVAHSYQWDATSEVMEDWMYDQYAKKYAIDPNMQEWMRDVNPWALQRIAESLLEAHQRGMWNTTDEMVRELQNIYLSIEGELEDRSDG
ncbi:Aerobic cobaltochelatase subunit CobN [Sporomusa rhizae]|uniref:cobaltochelatase subunit CobN n=1 Tax=Sporomusa rhizae TaxID=357999 RepID=UPI00352A67E5